MNAPLRKRRDAQESSLDERMRELDAENERLEIELAGVRTELKRLTDVISEADARTAAAVAERNALAERFADPNLVPDMQAEIKKLVAEVARLGARNSTLELRLQSVRELVG